MKSIWNKIALPGLAFMALCTTPFVLQGCDDDEETKWVDLRYRVEDAYTLPHHDDADTPENELAFTFQVKSTDPWEVFGEQPDAGWYTINPATGEVMVILSLGEDRPDERDELLGALVNRFPEITSLFYVLNEKLNDTITDRETVLFHGRDHIIERMEDLQFKIGPKSFYQTNSEQAYNLYARVRELTALTGTETVYDLYTGTGTIANFLARRAARVVGIEYVPEAIDDARANSALNGIGNTAFFAGDMKDVLSDDFITAHGHPDVVITDPPRAGMHPDVVATILRTAPSRVVYVSCNSATQARDLALMDSAYRVAAVQPVDMFPHTHHVENIVLLQRRN